MLPAISKVYERLMNEQIMRFSEHILSSLLFGFKQGYRTQHALLRFVEKCRATTDKGFSGAVFMDLSKAFDSLNHELWIAKLDASRFSKSTLKLMLSYVTNRKQRVRINESNST